MSAVIGIIFDRERSRVLVLKRRDVPMWVFPGGGVDANEDPEDAVKREVLEETGLQVAVSRKVGEYSPLNRLARITHLYECRILSGTPTTGPETKNIGFYPIADLPTPFFHLHQEWLNDALQQNPEVIKKPITAITYWKLLKYFCRHPIWVFRLVLSRLGFPINS